MPELPEVESARRMLGPLLKGRTIQRVELPGPGVVAHPTPQAYQRGLAGKKIMKVGRRGKFLLLHLAGGALAVFHFRMTGGLSVAPQTEELEAHTHAVFTLDNGMQLRYVDPRRFGRLWLFEKDEPQTAGMEKLGPEPLDGGLDAAYLHAKLSACRRAVKVCLLDQTIAAGIGNIYADESLFLAHIQPQRSAQSLSGREYKALAQAIPKALKRGIAINREETREDFPARARRYRKAPDFSVYGRAGKPCGICGQTLQKTVVGGRTTVYCPHCQR